MLIFNRSKRLGVLIFNTPGRPENNTPLPSDDANPADPPPQWDPSLGIPVEKARPSLFNELSGRQRCGGLTALLLVHSLLIDSGEAVGIDRRKPRASVPNRAVGRLG